MQRCSYASGVDARGGPGSGGGAAPCSGRGGRTGAAPALAARASGGTGRAGGGPDGCRRSGPGRLPRDGDRAPAGSARGGSPAAGLGDPLGPGGGAGTGPGPVRGGDRG